MAESDRFESRRLVIEKMQASDFAFMKEILNSEGFLKFIGDRNVRTDEEAKLYIERTLKNKNIQYWIAKLKSDRTSIGLVSFVKRDYLPCHDVGFAFLPQYMKQGYAFEATAALLRKILPDYKGEQVLATTNKNNVSSIKLLEKLGLIFQKKIENNKKILDVYAADAVKLAAVDK